VLPLSHRKRRPWERGYFVLVPLGSPVESKNKGSAPVHGSHHLLLPLYRPVESDGKSPHSALKPSFSCV